MPSKMRGIWKPEQSPRPICKRNPRDMATPSATHETKSTDGSAVRLSWFNEGATAVVNIIREKTGVSFSMSRAEAEALRSFLPADKPD